MKKIICVGPGRTGTTWLYNFFKYHPDIGVAKVKETEFFNYNYQKGINWYESLFPTDKNFLVDVSNMYLFSLNSARKIKEHYPDAKILINIREPIETIKSVITHGLKRGLKIDKLNLDKANYHEYMGSGLENKNLFLSLKESIFISKYIKNYLEVFNNDNVFFVEYEKISNNPNELLSEICNFIGVKYYNNVNPEFIKITNQSKVARNKFISKISKRIATLLRQLNLLSILSFLKNNKIINSMILKKPNRNLLDKIDLMIKNQININEITDEKNKIKLIIKK